MNPIEEKNRVVTKKGEARKERRIVVCACLCTSCLLPLTKDDGILGVDGVLLLGILLLRVGGGGRGTLGVVGLNVDLVLLGELEDSLVHLASLLVQQESLHQILSD